MVALGWTWASQLSDGLKEHVSLQLLHTVPCALFGLLLGVTCWVTDPSRCVTVCVVTSLSAQGTLRGMVQWPGSDTRVGNSAASCCPNPLCPARIAPGIPCLSPTCICIVPGDPQGLSAAGRWPTPLGKLEVRSWGPASEGSRPTLPLCLLPTASRGPGLSPLPVPSALMFLPHCRLR